MRKNPHLFRLSATVAIGALLCNPLLPTLAAAQPAPPPQAAQPGGDPPARVGRVASQSGAVSYRTSADTQWSAATLNFPVSSGASFWTEPTARASLEIGASHIDLAGQTELDVTTLEDSGLQAVAPQGELYLHLIDLAPNEVWTVNTPRGLVRMTEAGQYDVAVGTTDQPTTITVLAGAAEMEGPGVSLKIGANQTATVTGTDTFQGTVGPAVRDAFFAARLAAEHPPARPAGAIPPSVGYMSGGADLYGYGQWSQTPDYGEVWYPPVSATWVPYRDGDWAYVEPWGWTWVDSDPWGFAPFHYGRWARVDGRWGWIPGEGTVAEPPAYAPALVTFIGIGAGIAVGAALASGSVGWVPLGPREAYHPWYHTSDNYLRRINSGRDMAAVNANVSVNNFVNRAGATSVPASVMMGSRPVRGAARPIPPQALASAHPVIGQQPIRPTVATLGVTPAVARRLDLHPAGREAPPRAAPGPVVRAAETTTEHGQPPRPALLGPHGEQPGAPRPAESAGARPGEPAGARPGEPAVARPEAGHPPGAPPLPTPGARPAGLPEPGAARSGEPGMPLGPHPEGVIRTIPGAEPNNLEPGGRPPLTTPGERPQGTPEQHEVRPGAPPPTGARPEAAGRPAPGGPEEHAAPEVRPAERAPEPRAEPVPHVAAPEAPRPPSHVEAPPPRPAEPPPRAAEPARPTPPPRVEEARPAAPPPRPAPPPPRPEAPPPRAAAPSPPPHPAPEKEKKPGER
jgi:hypothetical protein